MQINRGSMSRSITMLTRAIIVFSAGVLSATSLQSASASSRHHMHSHEVASSGRHHNRRHSEEASEMVASRHHRHQVASDQDSYSRHSHRYGRHHRDDSQIAYSEHSHRHRHSFSEASNDVSYHRSRSESHHVTHIASTKSSQSPSGNVVEVAQRFTGTRYVFGGTSRSGFDCSGYTRYVLGASAGISLPRTALEQYEHGKSISRSDLEPGDLVFFANTYRHGISHVGIYIGDGHFEHAANEREGVRVDSLDEKYYQEHYAGARRVIFDREYTER